MDVFFGVLTFVGQYCSGLILLRCVFLLNSLKDIDQLKKTMALTGTPGPELLAKITSEEVVRLLMIFSLVEEKSCVCHFSELVIR